MIDIEEIRRQNLRALIDGPPYMGDNKKFYEAAGITKGRLSQLLNGKEKFGETAAKNIEKKLGLQDNYLSFVKIQASFRNEPPPTIGALDANKKKPLSDEADRLARLLDLIPEEDLISRHEAYTKASTEVVRVIRARNQQATELPEPDHQKLSD